jgi:hypothetical protein
MVEVQEGHPKLCQNFYSVDYHIQASEKGKEKQERISFWFLKKGYGAGL